MAESGLHEDTAFPPLHAGSLSIAIDRNFLTGVTNERRGDGTWTEKAIPPKLRIIPRIRNAIFVEEVWIPH